LRQVERKAPMSTPLLSQEQRYGELLRDHAQYSRDIPVPSRLTREQEDALTARARAGDKQAREDILLSFYPYCEAVARKYAQCYQWASARLNSLDLMHEGMLRAIEYFDHALEYERPFAYLWKTIQTTILTYCLQWASPIKTVQNEHRQYEPSMRVTSLDAPLSRDSDTVLADLIEDIPVSLDPERDYTFLYEALETLPARNREAVTRYYGIGCAPEPYELIGKSWGHEHEPHAYAGNYGRRGVAKLKRQLHYSAHTPPPYRMEPVYTAQEACERLQVSLQTLCTYVTQQRLRRVKRGLYVQEDVDQLAAQRHTASGA
jgi:RNA polymerase sigma factor (sigma-70 family)